MKWACVVVGGNYPTDLRYVAGYNNTLAQPTTTLNQEGALTFGTAYEASEWGRKYLVGRNWQLITVKGD